MRRQLRTSTALFVVCGQSVVWPGIGSTPRLVLGVVSRSNGGAPGGTRTHDLQVRNLTLYPLSYGRNRRADGLAELGLGHQREKLAEREGFEPSEQVTPLNGLANRRTRPLCDLSVARRPES